MAETTTLHCRRMPSKASLATGSFFSEQSSEGQSSKDFQYRKDLMNCNSYAKISTGSYGQPSERSNELSMDMLDRDLSPSSAACLYNESHYDDYDGLTRRERILLRPWLENLIDSGQVPGLEWIDRDKYIFKVPWKHRSKKSWSVEHSSVFLEWAKNTGRWREGDPEPNYAQLKTRLRCAFNKAPDIQEVKELHKTKCEDAYKVYRFVPKKESRFGSFTKKKMLIPTSIKRKRSSWLSWSKQQAAPVKKVKQESGLVQLENIKIEPKCATPDNAYPQSNNTAKSINTSYPCSNYQYDVKNSLVESNNHYAILNSSHSISSSSEKPLLLDEHYQAKYPKQNHLYADANYIQERGAPYPRVKSQVPFHSFSDIAADISRKRNLIEDSGGGGNGDAFQNGIHFDKNSFNNSTQADQANSQNYRQGYSQKYHDGNMEGYSKNVLTNESIEKERSRALGNLAFSSSSSLNPAGQRLPYLENVNYHHIQAASFEAADLAQHGFAANAYSEASRGVARSRYDPNLYSKPQMTSSYIKENSPPHQLYQTHPVPQRSSHDKLNFLGTRYDFAAESDSTQAFEMVNGKPKLVVLENQVGKTFLANHSHESSVSNNNNLVNNSQPPPLQPRFNACHTSHMFSVGSSNELLQRDAILNGHKEDGGGEQYRKSSSLTRSSKARSPECGEVESSFKPAYSNISEGENGREKELSKVRESCNQSAFDCNMMEVGSMDFKHDSHMQGVLAEENATSLAINKSSNKPATTNGLDLTKKNRVAVAPFMSSSRQQQPIKGGHADVNKDPGKSRRDHQEDLSDHLGIPALSNIKVLDLIEWERRLIERERELLARERLMSMREKNLRELDNFLELKYKSDFDAVKNNETLQRKMESRDPTRQTGQVYDFNQPRVTRKSPSDHPPPLSPLMNYTDGRAAQGLDYENRKWLDGFYNCVSDSDDDSSDLYYMKIVSNSYGSVTRSDSEAETKDLKRVESLFVNSSREPIHKVLKDCVVRSLPDDILVIGQDHPRFEKSYHQDSLVNKMDTSCLTSIDRSKVGSPEEEMSKVLPYVDALNCEKILHIEKMLDKDTEVTSSDGAEGSSSNDHSEPTQPEKEVKKDGVKEEVWKRRMKWLSFQGAQEKTLSAEKHWIWPVIGNLGQSKEPPKVENYKIDRIAD